MRKLLLISCSLLALTPAAAQTVDANGAKELATTLSKYFGKTAIEKNILSVKPEGDSYKITFSTSKLLEVLPKQELFKGDFGEYSFLTKPLADGSWDVTSKTLLQGSIEIDAATGKESTKWSAENMDLRGNFDPKIGTFSKATATYDGFKMSSTAPTQQMEATAGKAKAEMVATANAAGGVDFTQVQTIDDFKETISFKSDPAADENATDGEVKPSTPAAPEELMKIGISAASLGVDGKGSGFRYVELLDLWAFFVAHSDEFAKTPEEKTKLTEANQSELKTKLLAALPLWENLTGAYRFSNLNVESPVGPFLAKNISQEVNFDGISKNGTYNYALRTNGLQYPVLPIPDWTTPFLPTDVELSFGTAGLDLDTVVRGAIKEMDLNKEKPLPDAFTENTAAAFMLNPPKVVISKSLVRTVDAELSVEGEVTFAMMKPQSRTTWEMAGFDKLVDRLNKASEQEPEIKNYIVFAKLAKDFGNELPDGRIQWVVDQKVDGSIQINGNAVKGPDEAGKSLFDPSIFGIAPDDDAAVTDDDDAATLDDDSLDTEDAPIDGDQEEVAPEAPQ
ncbi:hypothetical protein [Phyllobacterium sp. YR531]|uniref:hypothetical protein n=1 Tax=Phyllobacterium sp. YR531 TaxID=1144343 RepID=UPI00026FBAB7|nr:hypothetical protein [Phyllobacterium sp. YR531]EJN04824.1 hypothetical protein PMI41_01289 [Phyllobacterium sp. YR531]